MLLGSFHPTLGGANAHVVNRCQKRHQRISTASFEFDPVICKAKPPTKHQQLAPFSIIEVEEVEEAVAVIGVDGEEVFDAVLGATRQERFKVITSVDRSHF